MFGQSGPYPRAHLSSMMGQWAIVSFSNLERPCMDGGRYVRFSQLIISRRWRDERLPSHSGKDSSPSKSRICKLERVVNCWIKSGKDLSSFHPTICSFSRFATGCWDKFRAGKSFNFSEKPPILSSFNWGNQHKMSSGIWLKLGHLAMVKEMRCLQDFNHLEEQPVYCTPKYPIL